MDTDCVFTVQNSDGLSNFGHIADGFDGVKEFVPEGLSVEGTTIIDDETGAKAKDFILRYRSLSDDADVAVSIDPKTYVYDGKEKKPAVTVSYGGKTLTEGKVTHVYMRIILMREQLQLLSRVRIPCMDRSWKSSQ